MFRMHYEIIRRIVTYIESDRDAMYKPMAFFHTNPTEETAFDDLSKRFRIGIMSNDGIKGRALMRLTRMLFNDTPQLIVEELANQFLEGDRVCQTVDDIFNSTSMERIIVCLAYNEGPHIKEYLMDEPFSFGEEQGIVYPDEVEWYTAARVIRLLNDALNEWWCG